MANLCWDSDRSEMYNTLLQVLFLNAIAFLLIGPIVLGIGILTSTEQQWAELMYIVFMVIHMSLDFSAVFAVSLGMIVQFDHTQEEKNCTHLIYGIAFVNAIACVISMCIINFFSYWVLLFNAIVVVVNTVAGVFFYMYKQRKMRSGDAGRTTVDVPVAMRESDFTESDSD